MHELLPSQLFCISVGQRLQSSLQRRKGGNNNNIAMIESINFCHQSVTESAKSPIVVSFYAVWFSDTRWAKDSIKSTDIVCQQMQHKFLTVKC